LGAKHFLKRIRDLWTGNSIRKTFIVDKVYNLNVQKVIRLSRDMMVLADEGDNNRQDRSCGVLYGTLRDSAYKLRDLAEQEKQLHLKNGIWDQVE